LVQNIGQVKVGRYRGVQNQIGFDGLWQSPTSLNLVVEVKTTETYAIRTATLLNYIDELISEKRIASREAALGLYVVGRPDPELRQLENSIVAENNTHRLRVISVESLLSLAEIMSEYDVSHEDMLVVLRPSGPGIDALADLIARLIAQETVEQAERQAPATATRRPISESGTPATPPVYWLTPVRGDEDETAIDCIQNLVVKYGIYAFGERTPGRRHIKQGDWICFYANAKGVVAHASVSTAPENKPDQRVRHPQDYPYTLHVQDQRFYAENPVVVDATVRQRLDAFRGRDPDKSWAWFVQATRKITEHDFRVLTRK